MGRSLWTWLLVVFFTAACNVVNVAVSTDPPTGTPPADAPSGDVATFDAPPLDASPDQPEVVSVDSSSIDLPPEDLPPLDVAFDAPSDTGSDASLDVPVDTALDVGVSDLASEEVAPADAVATPCRSSRECAPFNLVCDFARGYCVECAMDADCATGRYCTPAGACAPQACTPSSRSCVSMGRVRECDTRGSSLTERDCPSGTGCVMGVCQTQVCSPGAASCATATERRVCNADGFGYTTAACATGESCVMGACRARICVPGEASCTTMTERRVCNTDGLGYTVVACTAPVGSTATCTGGVCRVNCAAGFADCDGNTANGCEVPTDTDASNCGGCGNVCPTPANGRALCVTGGNCGLICLSGYGDCDTNPANGCEANFNDDATCGTCSTRCATGEVCDRGRCVPRPRCIPPLTACRARCVDFRSDATACGACDRACATGEACVLGRCAPASNCDSTRGLELNGTACRVLWGDAANCTRTGLRCGYSTAAAVCAGDGCAAACPSGLTQCDRDCANLQFNPAHCGRCNNRCLPGQACYNGACVASSSYCPAPFALCGTACVDFRSDSANCGACARACATGEACVLGRCAPASNCDSSRGLELNGTICRVSSGDAYNCGISRTRCGPSIERAVCAGDGCAAACPSGLTQCDRDCANLQFNPAHCGRCNNRCLPGQACYNGACVASSSYCPAPFALCGTACVDFRSDSANCGACARACATGEACVLGRCAPASTCGLTGEFELSGNNCRMSSGDAYSCGSSRSRCGPNTERAVCASDGCVAACPPNLTQCDRDCANLQFNPAHCGGCNNRCLPGQTCYNGACVASSSYCPAPFALCGTACVDFRSDAANCGACGRACATSEACVLGRCAPASTCGLTGEFERTGTTCRMLSGDAYNCGTSRSRCGYGNGRAVCAGDDCAAACPPNLTQCDRDCANLQFNPAHCGGCNNRCLPGQTCYNGACVAATPCPPPFVTCGTICADFRSDAANCGACGRACATGEACVLGRCAPSSNCDIMFGLDLNGTTCRVSSGDAYSCGSSRSRCGYGVGRSVCAGDGCAAACPSNLTQCDRDCANLQFNPAHCGRCNNRCLPGQACYGGACITL